MTEKIKWYQEVLEVEPNSKLFFPLARLLAQEGDDNEAIRVLEHGLARHGEFLEARLLLIELLHTTGRTDACADQVRQLSAMFASYAGFWQAWAACLATIEGDADTASVLRFLAAYFLHGPIALHDVLNRGLATYLNDGGSAPGVQRGVGAGARGTARPAPSVAHPATFSGADTAAQTPQAPAWGAPAMAPHAVPEPHAAPAQPFPRCDEDGEEQFSLRTRSMAEVLAEQGDIRGALDIYNELAAAATAPEECADLEHRIATLSARLAPHEAPAPAEPADSPDPGKSTEKLISMLEALAERVEARAQG